MFSGRQLTGPGILIVRDKVCSRTLHSTVIQ